MTGRQEYGDGRRGVFILSASDRDGLAAMAGQGGWRVIAARRVRGVEQRFLASDAQIALVDARATQSAETLVRPFATAVEACGGALVVIVGEGQEARVPALVSSGATHYLAAPVTPDRLAAALSTAWALVDRQGGGAQQSGSRHAIRRSDALVWRLDRHTGLVTPSVELARHLGIRRTAQTPRVLLRTLVAGDRPGAFAAIREVAMHGMTAAFAHDAEGISGRRAAHHLHTDPGGIVGEIELLPGGAGRPRPEERDYLTGLSNRPAALAWLGGQLGPGNTPPVVLLLSISQLDRTNTAYGQLAGDALLGRLARRIERLVEDVAGSGGLSARIAGTEFLVGLSMQALGDAGIERAKFLARRLVAAVGQPFSAGDHLIRLTGRCGIAEARRGDDAIRLLRRAASALADARQSDGEGIRILTADKHSREVDPDRLEADLRLALDRGEIGIGFQPQYATADDSIVGVEALARWTHPHYGPLGAGVLFAAAERSDFLLPLSTHIHEQALRLAATWPPALSKLRLAINVTAADISQPDFLESFLARVDASGFPRTRLTVEITESGLIDDLEAVAALLDRVRAAGLSVAIDDFGTGYSSLAYLKSLPLDYLKIDSGLAQDIAGNPRDRIVVRGVIQMARSLGLKVVAEGGRNRPATHAAGARGVRLLPGVSAVTGGDKRRTGRPGRLNGHGWTLPLPRRRCMATSWIGCSQGAGAACIQGEPTTVMDTLFRIVLRIPLRGIQRLRRLRWRVMKSQAHGAHGIPVTPEGRIVLVKMRYMRGWHAPGGARKKGETAQQNVLRELREEIGMSAWSGVLPVSETRILQDHRHDCASLFIIWDVEYRPGRWSLEIEDVMEADPDRLPPDMSQRTLGWIAAVRDVLKNHR